MGWHDAGTYDSNIKEWPKRGGANGSLRFEVELKHAANAGLSLLLGLGFRVVLIGSSSGLANALNLLQPIKDRYPGITYADLFQLASATAVEVCASFFIQL